MRKYGWPAILFIGVPVIFIFVRSLYFYAQDSGLFTNDSILQHSALYGLTTVVLLGVLYLWVRNSERATLRLVWSCTLVLAATWSLMSFYGVWTGFDILEFSSVLWTVSILTELVILLWFARRASRLSLAHALFLVAIVGGLWFPDFPDSLPILLGLIWEPAWILAAGIPAVWLLSNFDLRSKSFRKWSVVAVIAWQGLEFLSDFQIRPWTSWCSAYCHSAYILNSFFLDPHSPYPSLSSSPTSSVYGNPLPRSQSHIKVKKTR